MSTLDGGAPGGLWRTAPGWSIDTATDPDWLRTGYRYFPYAARVDDRWWTLRANYCFPAHDAFTVFIDDHAVAEVTAGPDDHRPLVAGIGRLAMTHPDERSAHLPVMAPALAIRVIGVVARFVNHGSEWEDPCIYCEFAERDPLELTRGDPHIDPIGR